MPTRILQAKVQLYKWIGFPSNFFKCYRGILHFAFCKKIIVQKRRGFSAVFFSLPLATRGWNSASCKEKIDAEEAVC